MDIEFEGKIFYIPRNYYKILKMGYGNYMELPPEEKRWVGHNIEKIDFGPYVSEKI